MSDAISVLDGDGTIRFSTGVDAAFLGYSDEEWQSIDIRTLVHPDD